MIRKLLDATKGKKGLIEPQQGTRLLREMSGGDVLFTIKGSGFPGFFIIFGLMFGGIPLLILSAMVFGTPSPENGPFVGVFVGLFLTPFIAIGGATFLTGLFLWLGRTRVRLGATVVSVQRELFGKSFQRKEFARSELELFFEESHKNNDVPAYKLTLKDGGAKNKVGLGGSLKEENLLWLERELKVALGREAEVHAGVEEAISAVQEEGVYESVVDPSYRSKNLRFTRTNSGWESVSRSTIPGALGLMVFGGIFLFAGLMMGDVTRGWLFGVIPWLGALAEGVESSDGSPPVWFALIFGGVGLLVVLAGLYSLGARIHIARRHSRLHLKRQWFIFSMSWVIEKSELESLEVKKSGAVNDVPRFVLKAVLKSGKKHKLIGFASVEDCGQIRARVAEMMPGEGSGGSL